MSNFTLKRNRVPFISKRFFAILFMILAVIAGHVVNADAQAGRFAVIGDYGNAASGVADVAGLINTWDVDFIITVGDNSYGERPYDETVGQFYCDYLRDAGSGSFCSGGSGITNDFYPSMGNHDRFDPGGADAYLNYFTLPGTGDLSTWTSGSERYYDFVRGAVHFFVLDSQGIVDSASEEAAQKDWLKTALAGSTSPWQIVFFHHSPYSSGAHGSVPEMRWPFAAWGADAVISGHDHIYERLFANGIAYFVNGLGGTSAYSFDNPVPVSQASYNTAFGAMLVDADADAMNLQFVNTAGIVIDAFTVTEPSPPGIIDVWVEDSPGDVEQRLSDGAMYITSSDIELGDDIEHWGEQAEGLRFRNIHIPQGAEITSAYLEFIVDEVGDASTVVEIRAQDSGDAPEFSDVDFDLTSRAATSSAVSWDIPAWNTVGELHQSPDLSTVIKEVVDRSDWQAGNNMAFIINGTGRRTAESWDGDPASAALLHIEYSIALPNIPPSASFMVSTSGLTADFTDTSTDSDGTITGWLWDFGDGGTSSEQHPSHSYASGGTYMVNLTVTDDDGDPDSASRSVTVTAPNIPPSASFMVSTSGLTADFTDTSTDSDGTITGWLWDFGDGSTSSEQNPSHAYASGGTYTVNLTVTDDDGDPDSASRSVTVTASLLAPSKLRAHAVSTSRIKLRWIDNSTNELGFLIERSLDGAVWTLIAKVGQDRQRYMDRKLMSDTTYYYRVSAFNNAGVSEPSNVAYAKTHAAMSMHVSSMEASAKKKRWYWKMRVKVTLEDNDGNPVRGAWIMGDWSRGVWGRPFCITNAKGSCSVKAISSLRNNTAVFKVRNAFHRIHTYDPENNVVSSITIHRPD